MAPFPRKMSELAPKACSIHTKALWPLAGKIGAARYLETYCYDLARDKQLFTALVTLPSCCNCTRTSFGSSCMLTPTSVAINMTSSQLFRGVFSAQRTKRRFSLSVGAQTTDAHFQIYDRIRSSKLSLLIVPRRHPHPPTFGSACCKGLLSLYAGRQPGHDSRRKEMVFIQTKVRKPNPQNQPQLLEGVS